MYLARQMVDSMRMDRQESATRLDAAHATAFTDAMTALELVTERVTAQQTSMFERTVDMVAGPQGPTSADAAFAVDNPSLDARARWVPDDEFDYTSLGIDPTDDDMPLPRLEPEGNEHRATMVRPGEGLMPS
jgi:hypothetical protein